MKLSPLHLVLGICVCCSSTEEGTGTSESGQVGTGAYMLDEGLEDGVWATWHENGPMQAKGQFKNGRGEGPWIYWEEDGQLGATGQWNRGRRDGRWTDWHENGAMKSDGRIKNGQREGPWTLWYENGVQRAGGAYVLDRREGAWTFWDEDHDVMAAGMYAGGQPVGDWRFAPEGLREKKDAVRARAETLLQLLRAKQWGDAADFVLIDEVARRRFGISGGADPEASREEAARFFEGMYGSLWPGSVRSVRIDPKDPELALVAYRCGDLDAFRMRLADGEWSYSFE